jgi:hypothetical protein
MTASEFTRGIRENRVQVAHQLIQVMLVGFAIGMTRTVVPALAESEFGLERGSFLLLASFVVAFGAVKAAMNFVAGRWSERIGRKRVLALGWVVARPIPVMIWYPDVRPLVLSLPVDDAFVAALALVEDRGWEVLSADPAESQIEAIARSRLFGFENEVAIRVPETATGARIDMRSRSRLGQIDRGANARRIAAFLADLKTVHTQHPN